MNTLAIDIGGTKLSMALFQDERMVLRQTHITQRDGGRSWMLRQISAIAELWRKDSDFDCCGVGFGGPVDYKSQRVITSNVVNDWQEFPLAASLQAELGVLTVIALRTIFHELARTNHLAELAHLLLREDIPRSPHPLLRPLTPEQDQLLQQELIRRNARGAE